MSNEKWTEERVLKLMALINTMDTLSLDARIQMEDNHDDGCCIGDIIKDDGPTPQDIVEEKASKERLFKYISKLSPREQFVIRMRYGLDDGIIRTLDEIGQKYGVTRERIRQVEAKALRKLKRSIIQKDGVRYIRDF